MQCGECAVELAKGTICVNYSLYYVSVFIQTYIYLCVYICLGVLRNFDESSLYLVLGFKDDVWTF